MYTFEFTYDRDIDDFGSIQFCAKTRSEAETLFKEWCEENDLEIDEYDVKITYNTYDAQEYGDDYMPCVDLGLMKRDANTVWCDEDIGAALMDIGIEPSAENIRKVATPEFIKGFYNLMIQYGNEMICQGVSELFD